MWGARSWFRTWFYCFFGWRGSVSGGIGAWTWWVFGGLEDFDFFCLNFFDFDFDFFVYYGNWIEWRLSDSASCLICLSGFRFDFD